MRRHGIWWALWLGVSLAQAGPWTVDGSFLQHVWGVWNRDGQRGTAARDVLAYVELAVNGTYRVDSTLSLHAALRAWGFERAQYAPPQENLEAYSVLRLYQLFVRLRPTHGLVLEAGRLPAHVGMGLTLTDNGGYGMAGLRANLQRLTLFALRPYSTLGGEGVQEDVDILGAQVEYPAGLTLYALHREAPGEPPASWVGGTLVRTGLDLEAALRTAAGRRSGAVMVWVDRKAWGLYGGWFQGDDPTTPEDEGWHDATGDGSRMADGFSRGWVGYGEVMTFGLADPYNLYWGDLSNFRVLGLYLQKAPRKDLTLRMDVLIGGLDRVPAGEDRMLGGELDLHGIWTHPGGAQVGLSAGVLWPGSRMKQLNQSAYPATLRFWSMIPLAF